MPGMAYSEASSLGDGSELEAMISKFLNFCRRQDRLRVGKLPRLKLEEALRTRYRSLLAALSAKEVLSLLWEYSSLSKQLIHHVDYNLFCANLYEKLEEKYDSKLAQVSAPAPRSGSKHGRKTPSPVYTPPASAKSGSYGSPSERSPDHKVRKTAWAASEQEDEPAPRPATGIPTSPYFAPDSYRVEMEDFNRRSCDFRRDLLDREPLHVTGKVGESVAPLDLSRDAATAGTCRLEGTGPWPLPGLLGRKARVVVPPQMGHYDPINHKWIQAPQDPRFSDPEGRAQPWEYDMRPGSKRGHRGRRHPSDRVGTYDPIRNEWIAPPANEGFTDREGIVLESGRVLPSDRCGGKGMVGKPDRLLGRYNPLTHEWHTPPREEHLIDREYPAVTPGPAAKATNQPYMHKTRRHVTGPASCGNVIAWPSPNGAVGETGRKQRVAPGRKIRL